MLLQAARARVGPGVHLDTGRVRHLGAGLFRDVCLAYLEVAPDDGALSGDYAMAVPRGVADVVVSERARREAALLERLARLLPEPSSFRVPRVLSAVDVDGRTVLVREAVEGIPVTLRGDRTWAGPPWEVVGRVAAAVHGIATGAVADVVPGHATRREHAAALLEQAFGGLGPEVDAARSWGEAHLPPADPAAFLHGDLLGQNMLVPLDGPPTLIDWELALRGDPAHDVAIVTRGGRRPFGVERGLERLLEAYRAAGGHPVTRRDIRFYELCLAGLWYRGSLARDSGEPPGGALARVGRVLGWGRGEVEGGVSD